MKIVVTWNEQAKILNIFFILSLFCVFVFGVELRLFCCLHPHIVIFKYYLVLVHWDSWNQLITHINNKGWKKMTIYHRYSVKVCSTWNVSLSLYWILFTSPPMWTNCSHFYSRFLFIYFLFVSFLVCVNWICSICQSILTSIYFQQQYLQPFLLFVCIYYAVYVSV